MQSIDYPILNSPEALNKELVGTVIRSSIQVFVKAGKRAWIQPGTTSLRDTIELFSLEPSGDFSVLWRPSKSSDADREDMLSLI